MQLPRTVKRLATAGFDVEAHTIAMHRYLRTGQLAAFLAQPDLVRRRFGVGKRTLAKKAAGKAGLPRYGVIGPALFAAMWRAGAYDARARDLLERFVEQRKPKLIEPWQGWDSLHPSLWQVYSLGRRMGLADGPGLASGTYNPASRLPSGRLSDHAVYPALAFDLDIGPDTGWQNLKARGFFLAARLDPNVEYLILGDKIWSRGALRAYSYGGHLNHVHCSGHR